jgi:hypothetical protein
MLETGWMESPKQGPIDFDRVLADMAHDPEGFIAVCEVFLEECPRTLGELAGTARTDREELLGVLHEVANSLGVVGAYSAATIVRQMEMALREGAPLSLEDLAIFAAQSLVRVASAIEGFIEQRRRPRPRG